MELHSCLFSNTLETTTASTCTMTSPCTRRDPLRGRCRAHASHEPRCWTAHDSSDAIQPKASESKSYRMEGMKGACPKHRCIDLGMQRRVIAQVLTIHLISLIDSTSCSRLREACSSTTQPQSGGLRFGRLHWGCIRLHQQQPYTYPPNSAASNLAPPNSCSRTYLEFLQLCPR